MDNTMESLMSSIDAHILEKHKELLRQRYRENSAKWRLANAEKFKEYRRMKAREYYQNNKEKSNRLRMEQYHKKKERDRQKLQAVDV